MVLADKRDLIGDLSYHYKVVERKTITGKIFRKMIETFTDSNGVRKVVKIHEVIKYSSARNRVVLSLN